MSPIDVLKVANTGVSILVFSWACAAGAARNTASASASEVRFMRRMLAAHPEAGKWKRPLARTIHARPPRDGVGLALRAPSLAGRRALSFPGRRTPRRALRGGAGALRATSRGGLGRRLGGLGDGLGCGLLRRGRFGTRRSRHLGRREPPRERVERELRGGLLGVLLRAPRAAPHHLALEVRLDLEDLRVVRPVLRDHPVPRSRTEPALRDLLEPRPVVPIARPGGGARDRLPQEAA